MANINLEILLAEYEEKRRRADFEFEKRKEKIYKRFPRLEEIEDELNKIAISKTRAILTKQENTKSLEINADQLKAEKEAIIEKENIDLEKKYECNICKDTGYIQKENSKTEMCRCLKQRLLNLSYNMSNLSDIQNDTFENFNLDLFSDEGRKSSRKNINNIKNACLKFIEKFDNLETKNLLFYR